MILINFFIFGSLFALSTSLQFHNYLTDEEVQRVFNVGRSEIPEYDIVTIDEQNFRKKRSMSMGLSIDAFNKNHEFNLELSDGLLMGKHTPFYYATYYTRRGQKVERFIKINYDVNMLAYQDAKSKAAIVTSRNKRGQLEIRGTIGDNLSIQPLNSFIKTLNNDSIARVSKRSVNYWNNILEQNKHIVIKLPNEGDMGKFLGVELPGFNLTTLKKAKRDVVDIVYPQLLVLVDFHMFQKFHSDAHELVKYLFAVYNSVDLRYRSLQYPKVRLNIVSIIIEKKPETFSFLTESKVKKNLLLVIEALNLMGFYLIDNEYFAKVNHDITITMTDYNLVRVNATGDYITGTVGIAYRGGACERIKGRDKTDRSLAIVQDRKPFGNINVIAHELGHLFGAFHDGVSNRTEDCVDDNIMISIYNEMVTTWSKCSQHYMQRFLRSPHSVCLRNKPVVNEPLKKIFPGQIMKSLHEQCHNVAEGTVAVMSSDPDFPCNKLTCTWSDNVTVETIALDGTSCQNNAGMCMQGQCVPVKSVYL